MPFRVDCPFCNAGTVLAEPLAKTACGRCGEAFAPTAYHETADATISSPIAPTPTASKVGLLFVGLAVLGAIAAVTAWQLVKPPVLPLPPATPAAIVPPTALTGLQYLPAACNIVAAIQPAAVAAYAERNSTSVYILLGAYGVPSQMLDAVDRAGLTLDQIDHILVGAVFDDTRLIPGVTVVLKLRQPVDEAAFFKLLHAERKPQAGKSIYTTKLNGLLMTPVDATTYLFGLGDADLAPRATGQPLNAALQTNLQQRLSPASFAWLATDTRDWSQSISLLKIDAFKKYAAKLVALRSLSLGLALEPDPTLKLMIDLAGEATARDLEAFFHEKFETAMTARDGSTVKLLAPATTQTSNQLRTVMENYFQMR